MCLLNGATSRWFNPIMYCKFFKSMYVYTRPVVSKNYHKLLFLLREVNQRISLSIGKPLVRMKLGMRFKTAVLTE